MVEIPRKEFEEKLKLQKQQKKQKKNIKTWANLETGKVYTITDTRIVNIK